MKLLMSCPLCFLVAAAVCRVGIFQFAKVKC